MADKNPFIESVQGIRWAAMFEDELIGVEAVQTACDEVARSHEDRVLYLEAFREVWGSRLSPDARAYIEAAIEPR